MIFITLVTDSLYWNVNNSINDINNKNTFRMASWNVS